MKVKAFRIPRQVILPGLLVTVKQVKAASTDLDGADATWAYDEDIAVIFLRKTASLKRKRYLLIHELGHVMWDYLHDVRDNHKHVVDKP